MNYGEMVAIPAGINQDLTAASQSTMITALGKPGALVRVFAAIKAHKPDLYAVLTTAGMTCCRAVRGSTTQFSNHSWGTAIDLSIHGVLTPLGSKTVQRGMVEAAPFFHAERFFWGAGYHTRPDGMHFEASNELIAAWKASGSIP